MAHTDIFAAFHTLEINHVHDDYARATYDVIGDSGAARTFTFTTTRTQEVFVSADFYNPRMYPPGCKYSTTRGLLSLSKGTTVVASVSFDDSLSGNGFLRQ